LDNKFAGTIRKENQIVCSVCIATFKRPELLKELIKSLFEQKDIEDIILEIIIVDNDSEKSAKETVERFSDTSSVKISYYTQPIRNISLTRNMTLDKSTGQYLAILDDDETADKYWIRNLIDSIERYNADAVFGYVIPVFDSNIAQWKAQREIYFLPMGKTGDPPLFRYTTNCLIRSEKVKKFNLRFDPEYGLSGGEDGVFFDMLYNVYKFKYVACREAITYEFVPEFRTKLKNIFKRNFQKGNNIVWHAIESGDNEYYKIKILLFIRTSLAIGYYGLQSLLFLPYRKKWIFGFKDLSINFGKLLAIFNFKLRKYRTGYG